MVFFSPNKETAQKRINQLARTNKALKGKKAKLAKNQIPHISNWKTYKAS